MSSDPRQLALVPDPAKSADKQRVLSVRHEHVVAYCESRQLKSPTAGEWHNCHEVLTYMIFARTELGIRLTVDEIRNRAFHPKVKSKRVVERALTLLRRLGALSSMPLGNKTEHVIHFDWLDEIRRSGDPIGPPSVRQTVRQNALAVADPWRTGGREMADPASRNGGADLLAPNLPYRPTTPASDGGADWSAVVLEVRDCGVNQSKAAVELARAHGAMPEDVRAIVAEWQTRRVGWQYAPQNLYRRLCGFDAKQSPSDGWPPLDEAYQAKLDLEQQAIRDRETYRKQFANRRRYAAEREKARREWDHERFMRQVAEASPELAAGIIAAGKRREIEARQFDRQHEIRRQVEVAGGAGRDKILADRLTAHRARVEEIAAELGEHQPRPP